MTTDAMSARAKSRPAAAQAAFEAPSGPERSERSGRRSECAT